MLVPAIIFVNRVDDQGRNVRQRVEELETRMDAAEAQARSHETRLVFFGSACQGSTARIHGSPRVSA